MRKRRFLIWIFLILAAIAAVFVISYLRANAAWQQEYRNRISSGIVELLQNNPYDKYAVVVIVIDGLRFSEGIGAEEEYIPHIWNDLRPMGTLLTNVEITSPTATTSSHTAMMTGRMSTVPNDGHIRPVFPTYMEYFRDARSEYLRTEIQKILRYEKSIFRPDAGSLAEIEKLQSDALEFSPDKTALYLGKDLISSLDQSSSGHYPEDDVHLMESLRDIEVTEYFRARVPHVKPNLVFVNLADVDEAGHEVVWHYYVDAIRWADHWVWTMWQSLQELNRYRDKTYFIITTDHGRHIPRYGGYAHHGDFCTGCKHSFMLLVGPGIKKGYVSDKKHTECDLAPTIGAMMGFSTPGVSGSVIGEIFEDPLNLPDRRMTTVMANVEKDRKKVDQRDTPKVLLDKLLDQLNKKQWNYDTPMAMLMLAIASRLENRPDEASVIFEKIKESLPEIPRDPDISHSVLAYPMMVLGNALSEAGVMSGDEIERSGRELCERLYGEGLIDSADKVTAENVDIPHRSLIAAASARTGRLTGSDDLIRLAYNIMLETFEEYEGEAKVRNPGLDDFINDYKYRFGPNTLFTEKDASIRQKMWVLWGSRAVLEEGGKWLNFEPDPLLRRQYRLMVAFVHEWQDANAMVGGTGDLTEKVDMTAQGLCLASMAEFEPWKKWELDELQYNPDIYRTALYDWPPHHFFYILGQANALAGAWAANERLRFFVNDDGSIWSHLTDSAPALEFKDSPEEYIEAASALAYGLSCFENADYNEFDLQSYPIPEGGL